MKKRVFGIMLSLALMLLLVTAFSMTVLATEVHESFQTTVESSEYQYQPYRYNGEHFLIDVINSGDEYGFYLLNDNVIADHYFATISARNGEIITKVEFVKGLNNITSLRAPSGTTVTFDGDTATVSGVNAGSLTVDATSLLQIKSVTVYYESHTHDFTYTASGATITATCTAGCPDGFDTKPATLTIAAPTDLDYDGTAKAAVITDDDHIQGEAKVKYAKKTGEASYDTETENAPTDAGTYKASITLGEGEGAKTASVEYTIVTSTISEKSAPSKKTARTVLVTKAIASGKTKAKLSWNNAGADRYVVYYAECGRSTKKYKTVSGKTRSLTVSKLKNGHKYRFYVVAQKKSGQSYKTIATSGDAHMAAGNVSGRYTNVKALKVNRSAVNLKKGKTFTIKTSVTKVNKYKKLLNASHDPSIRYITNDPGVAVVNGKGKITAKGTGTCYIYVQAVNGIWKTVKVTVK